MVQRRVILALIVVLVAGCERGNSMGTLFRFPEVTCDIYGSGTGLGRYSTVQGNSSQFDCVFHEELVCIEPQTDLGKAKTLELIEYVRNRFASSPHINFVLNRTTVDRDVLVRLAKFENLTCLDISRWEVEEPMLGRQEVEVLLSMDSLEYLLVLERNFKDDSLEVLRERSKAKVVVGDRR